MKSPFIPVIKDPFDTANFDQEFTREEPEFSHDDRQIAINCDIEGITYQGNQIFWI